MPRGTTKERADMIARDFVAGGMKYAPIGRKYQTTGKKGGKASNTPSIESQGGKQIILKNSEVQKSLEELMNSKGVDDELITRNVKQVLEEKAQKKPTWSEKHAFVRTYLQVTGRLKEGNDSVQVGVFIER